MHKRECHVFAREPDVLPGPVVACMRILRGVEAGQGLFGDVMKLQAHRDEVERAGGKKWDAVRLMARTACQMVGQEARINDAVLATCIVMCNAFRLLTPTFDPLGIMLDPCVCIINHSCAPNAVLVFDGPALVVRALEPIAADAEILVTYIDDSQPYSVRQAELRDQYFFDCTCPQCQQGRNGPQDAFLEPDAGFDERIQVIEPLIPQLKHDPAWPRHRLGDSPRDQRLSALQFYAYSFLQGPDTAADPTADDVAKLRKAITILRNSRVWPPTRAPLPALSQQYAVACLSARRYHEALLALLRLHARVDPALHPQPHHPVRVVRAWTLATLAKAVGGEPDAPFCRALRDCGVDLSLVFVGLLMEVRGQVRWSHGRGSRFGRMVESAWQDMMAEGGELDRQYAERGVSRSEWMATIEGQVREQRTRVKAFVENDALALQIDEALRDES